MLNLIEILILIGIILIVSELLVGIQIDLVLVGIALIIGGFIGLATSNFLLAIIISSILAVLYIVFGRNFIKKKIIVITKKTNIDKLIGEKGIVVQTITPDTPGLIRTKDEDWRALSKEVIFEKEKVEVVSIEGVTLNVVKIIN